MSKGKESVFEKIIVGIAISVGSTAISELVKLIKSSKTSIIDISEWDNSYNNINKILYKLDPEKFNKHRIPTTSNDHYEICNNTSYFIRLPDKNYIKIETYKNTKENKYYAEQRLKISFYGKKKYYYREKFLKDALRLTDEKHIRVQYLNEYGVSCDIIPHKFNKIVLDKDVKNRIINGLKNWSQSKKWYEEHELVHKIGVFLYGKPGTGKSTVARAISAMFNNAPILTIDPNNVMNSISGILKMRKKYNETIIVLIEDFDMYFKNREEVNDEKSNSEENQRKENNQNAIFQLLDGIYSTDNTIYIATTNYRDRIDPALIRYGRFDIQEELDYFDYDKALECVKLLGYGKKELDGFNLEYPVQPAYLQSKVMEYRSSKLINKR